MTKTALNKINYYLDMSTSAYIKHFVNADGDCDAYTTYAFYQLAEHISEAFQTVSDIKKNLFDKLVDARRNDFKSENDFLQWQRIIILCHSATYDAIQKIA